MYNFSCLSAYSNVKFHSPVSVRDRIIRYPLTIIVQIVILRTKYTSPSGFARHGRRFDISGYYSNHQRGDDRGAQAGNTNRGR